jgi:hypothetical protein
MQPNQALHNQVANANAPNQAVNVNANAPVVQQQQQQQPGVSSAVFSLHVACSESLMLSYHFALQ